MENRRRKVFMYIMITMFLILLIKFAQSQTYEFRAIEYAVVNGEEDVKEKDWKDCEAYVTINLTRLYVKVDHKAPVGEIEYFNWDNVAGALSDSTIKPMLHWHVTSATTDKKARVILLGDQVEIDGKKMHQFYFFIKYEYFYVIYFMYNPVDVLQYRR